MLPKYTTLGLSSLIVHPVFVGCAETAAIMKNISAIILKIL